MLYFNGAGNVPNPAEGVDDDGCRDRFRISKPHRVRGEDGEHAASDIGPGTLDLTARQRSSKT